MGRNLSEAHRAKINAAFNSVPEEIREDVVKAAKWAKKTLKNHEGRGHVFQLCHEKDGISFNFSKPEWSGDHTGSTMETGSEAIVMAVCEYLNGA